MRSIAQPVERVFESTTRPGWGGGCGKQFVFLLRVAALFQNESELGQDTPVCQAKPVAHQSHATCLGYYKREGKRTVYLWPTNAGDHPPLVLRLVRLGKVYLITSVSNPKELSRAAASDLYRRRWGLEVSFRTLKQTLERRKVRSCAAKQARAELTWSVIALWVLMLLGARILAGAGIQLRRLSVAKALASIRHAMTARCSERALRHRLRKAVLDPYRRRGSKKARRWPHKKNPPPPGPPNITTATRTQVAMAKSLRLANTTT